MAEREAIGRALLIIDQEPIRRSTTNEMQSLYSKIQRMRKQIEEFESTERPAFTRWLRKEFDEPLNDLARLQDRLEQAEDLANEVQMVRFALNCSYYDAYVNTMERRKQGIRFPHDEQDEFEENDERQDDGDLDEDDCSTHSQKRDSKKSAKGESFEMHDSEKPKANSDDEADTEDQSIWAKIKNSAKSSVDSLKNSYRELARLLHPDLKGNEQDEWSTELWHRTQSAYADEDEAELQQLLVLARVSSNRIDNETTIWDLKRGILFLKKSMRDLKAEINLMRQDMAWGFIGLKDRTRLRRKISYDLEYQYDEAIIRLETLEAQLARWSVPPPQRKRARSQQRRSSWDLEIDF